MSSAELAATTTDSHRPKSAFQRAFTPGNILLWVFATLVVIMILIPLYILIKTSVSTLAQATAPRPSYLIESYLPRSRSGELSAAVFPWRDVAARAERALGRQPREAALLALFDSKAFLTMLQPAKRHEFVRRQIEHPSEALPRGGRPIHRRGIHRELGMNLIQQFKRIERFAVRPVDGRAGAPARRLGLAVWAVEAAGDRQPDPTHQGQDEHVAEVHRVRHATEQRERRQLDEESQGRRCAGPPRCGPGSRGSTRATARGRGTRSSRWRSSTSTSTCWPPE